MPKANIILISTLMLAWPLLSPAPAPAQTIVEVFQQLPDEQCGGFNQEERRYMVAQALEAQDQESRLRSPVPPDIEYPWINVESDQYLILNRPGGGPISYKLFNADDGSRLLAVCRGRHIVRPGDPNCELDLCLFRVEWPNIQALDAGRILPPISVLDFIQPETLQDPKAVRDLAAIDQNFYSCLTCHASSQNPLSLDIITTSNINARPCAGFLAPYELLPLAWNGRTFDKPYDRAAVPGDEYNPLFQWTIPHEEQIDPR